MQFLDAIGLASFWEKIKDWANSRFFSQRGGYINPKTGLQYTIDGEQLSITISGNKNETIDIFNVDENRMEAIAIVKTGGTATQVLMADGSVRTLNAANGICGLDANGRIPLAQLGNLDTSLFKLVTSLPSSGESNKIYIVKDGSDANDVYQEYYYTNGAWEKIGTHTVKVDLTPYAKKVETVDFSSIRLDKRAIANTPQGLIEKQVILFSSLGGKGGSIELEEATFNMSGLMSVRDKNRLDNIADGATADSAIPISVINALN